MTRSRIMLMCGAAGTVLLGVIIAAAQYRRGLHTYYVDGDSIQIQQSDATPRTILWQPPAALDSTINSSVDEYEPRVSADGLVLMFVRGRAGENADIYLCHRVSGSDRTWSEPEPLGAINTPYDELGPVMSDDDRSLYFYSNRPGGAGGYDIWIAQRDGDQWGPAVNAGPAVNTQFNEYGVAASATGDRLCFASNRPRANEAVAASSPAWSATLRENGTRHDYDLYVCSIVDGVPGEAAAVAALNTAANEGAPAFSPVGDFLYFCSDREGGTGGYDLYRSRFLRGTLQPPQNIGAEVNTPFNDMDPALSASGFALHFSSDRAGAIDGQSARYDLYSTESREVFEQVEDVPIDWAGLATIALPFLLWLLSALIAVLLIILLWRGSRSGKLSLLARCLLASLIVHAMLMFLLTFWEVTGSIGRVMRGGGGSRVSVIASGDGGGLVGQVRGALTDVLVTPLSAPLSDRISQGMEIMREAAAPIRLDVNLPQVALNVKATTEMIRPSEAQPTLHRVDSPIDVPDADRPALTTPMNEGVRPDARAEAMPDTPRIAQGLDNSRNRVAEDVPRVVAAPATANLLMDAPSRPVAFNLDSAGSGAPSQSISDSNVPAVAVANLEGPSPAALAIEVGAMEGSNTRQAVSAEPSQSTTIPNLQIGTGQSTRMSEVAVPVLDAGNRPIIAIGPHVISIDALGPSTASESAAARESSPPSDASNGAFSGSHSRIESVQIDGIGNLPPATALEESAGVGNETDGTAEAQVKAPIPEHGVSTGRASASFGVIRSSNAESVSLSPDPNLGAALVGSSFIDTAGLRDADVQSTVPAGAASSVNTFEGAAPCESLDLNIRLPDEIGPAVNPYVQRAEEVRKDVVEQMGGSEATEKAVASALQWLAAHQAEDGRWAASDFDDGCGQCGGAAKFDTDIATTGLALLCMLGADHTHVKDGPYQEQVRRGLDWLRGRMKDDGDLRGDETMYSHGIATIALSEALGMTSDESLRDPVRRAVEFIARARNTTSGGWRYEPGQYGDTSVLGWQVMALVSARRAGLPVADDVLQTALKWIDRVSVPQRPGRYGYQPGQRFTPSMTAEGMFVLQLLGVAHDEPRMHGSVEYVMQHPPKWDDEASTYYWYYATLALYQHQGESWQRWNEALTQTLLDHQRADGAAAGSWDPADNWSRIGGRVYQTALCTLCLEVYYRYLPMYADVKVRSDAAPPAPNSE